MGNTFEKLGRALIELIEELGYYLALTIESLYWIIVGPSKKQPVRVASAFQQMFEIGVSGLPILFMLSFAIGVMLAIQGIHTLKQFGAETQVVLGIALSVTREFGPRVRLGAAFTQDEIGEIASPPENRCGTCGVCATTCPAVSAAIT